MTNQELEALWPAILRESRAAIRRKRFRSTLGDADDVAAEAALTIMRYPRATPGLIARVVRSKLVDLIRETSRTRNKKPEARPPAVSPLDRYLSSLAHRATSEEEPEQTDRSLELRQGMERATARQRRVLYAVLAVGSFADAARRLGVTRQAVTVVIKKFREKLYRCP